MPSQTSDELAPELIDEVRSRYGVGPGYARSYLTYWTRTRAKRVRFLAEILRMPPPEPMWFDFALSCVQRGEEVVRRLRPALPPSARRYLDVGCGFGGFLVAFARAGMEVRGIEIDPARIEFSLANCADEGLRDCVDEVSILEDGLPERLGTFDVITCVDVIEHVGDPAVALRNLAGLLNPGGVLFMVIPNKESLAFVASDGHFNLFGITLLDREDAIAYHRTQFGFPYDVGWYHPLDYYRARLERAGCSTSLLPSPEAPAFPSPRSAWRMLKAVRAFAGFLLNPPLGIPGPVARTVRRLFPAYLGLVIADALRALTSGERRRSFRLRYLTEFWQLLVENTGS